jgi:hypothetical protein
MAYYKVKSPVEDSRMMSEATCKAGRCSAWEYRQRRSRVQVASLSLVFSLFLPCLLDNTKDFLKLFRMANCCPPV